MAPQVSRIAIVFGLGILLFFAVRSQTVPEGFGEGGFHRKQGPERVAAVPIRHAGMAACVECHSDIAESTPHVKKGLHCETCHGPAQAHVDDWEKFKPKKPSTRGECARCHAMIVSRPAGFPQIDPKEHNPDSRCIDCHVIHPAAEDSSSKKEEGKP